MLIDFRSKLKARWKDLVGLSMFAGSLFLAGQVFAQGALSAPEADNSAVAVGQVSFLIGRATIERASQTLPVGSATELKVGDQVKTQANGHVHIRFVDGALVSLRPSSVLKIMEYRFDAKNPSASSVRFELDQGVVRAISGQAAESAKDKFRLNTPLAAIGVKGTDFVVEANQARVNAIVNQGAIILSPFDAQCRMDALGPCSTRFSRELSAATKGMALTYSMNMPSPQLLPTGQLKGSELLNLASPLSSASNLAAPIVASGAQPNQSSQSNSGAQDNSSTHVQQNRVDAKAYSGINQILVNTSSADSLAWGRWGSIIAQDSLTTPFINALQGRSVTVGDGYYFLFRNEAYVPNLLPFQQGVVNFSLQNSHAYFLDVNNFAQPAFVLSGQLGINFSNQDFSTTLNLSGPSMVSSGSTNPTTQTLQSSGKINPNNGIFLSLPPNASSLGLPSVAGAVSLDTKQAGYVFSLPSGTGQFKGATLWGR